MLPQTEDISSLTWSGRPQWGSAPVHKPWWSVGQTVLLRGEEADSSLHRTHFDLMYTAKYKGDVLRLNHMWTKMPHINTVRLKFVFEIQSGNTINMYLYGRVVMTSLTSAIYYNFSTFK